MSDLRFLFFIEREFHLAMLKNIMIYLHDKQMGKIALYSFNYTPSGSTYASSGLRDSVIRQYVPFPIEIISAPYSYKPDITFMADFSYQYVEGLGKIVNIGHGTICKGWFYTDKSISLRENCADLLCVPGTIHKEVLEKQLTTKIEVTGMPKLDNVFNETYDKKTLLHQFGLDPNNKTLLFAPTFNEEFSIVPAIQDRLRSYIPDYINIIIKLHGVAPEEWKDHYRRLAQTDRNIYYSEDYDICPYIVASDVLLTDLSSVIYEFLATGKPVILYDSPHQNKYINYDPNDLEYQFRDVGFRFTRLDSLQEILFRSLISHADTQKNTAVAKRFVTCQDGNSSEKVVTAAINMLKNDKKKSTILLQSNQKDQITELVRRYSNHYDIFLSSSLKGIPNVTYTKDTQNLGALFAEVNQKKKTPHLIFISEGWNCSVLLPDMLYNYMRNQTNHGIVCPLVHDNTIHYQNARLRIPNADWEQPYVTGIQITYSLTGYSSPIQYVNPYCFIVHEEVLKKLPISELTEETFMYLFLLQTIKLKKEISLAYDTVVYPSLCNNDVIKLRPKSTSKKPNKEDWVNAAIEIANPDQHKTEVKTTFLNPKRAKYTDSIVNKIEDLIAKGHYDEADNECELISSEMVSLYLKAKILTRKNDYLNAQKLLLSIDTNLLEPELNANIQALLGKILLNLNETKAAFEKINYAININANCSEALHALGTYHLIMQNPEKALEIFSRALPLDPHNTRIKASIGFAHQIMKNFDKAIIFYNDVMEIEEENSDVLFNLLQCAYECKKFKDIQRVLENYLTIHPANVDILFQLAGVYTQQQKIDDAIQTLDKLLLFNENYPGAKDFYDRLRNL